MRKHLVIVSYDGISTHYCGVGTIIRNTILTLIDLIKFADIKVSLAYIATDPNSPVFNESCWIDSRKLTKESGGYMIPLCNGTKGYTENDMWRSFEEWELASAGLASTLSLILNDSDQNLIFLHDTPFLLFQNFKHQLFDKKLRSFFLPHSSGLNHTFGDIAWRTTRVAMEQDIFNAISLDKNSFILAEGINFGKHLMDDYDVKLSDNSYLTNGLYFDQYSNWLSSKYSVTDLAKFDIVVDIQTKIIFSWGRCSIAKGFEQLLKAWQSIAATLPDHTLILQCPNNSGEQAHFDTLLDIAKNSDNVILLDNFDPEIWKTILRCENTKVVCIPSVMDPNPHTAIEAKLFSIDMPYAIVGSNIDGVKDTFGSNECIWVDPYNIRGFAEKLVEAAFLNSEERNKMMELNKANISNYDYAKKFVSFLNSTDYYDN